MEWYQVAIVFAVAFLVTYVSVPFSKWLARKMGAIDFPSNRRVNKEPVPRCGGVALYLGMVAACFVIFLGVRFFRWNLPVLFALGDVNYLVLYVGITCMFITGLVDDITQLKAMPKFLAQIAACSIVVFSGVSIGAVNNFGHGFVDLGWMNYPLSVLYLLVFVNITNLIDGLDGLAAGLVAIIAAALLYLAWIRGNYLLVLCCVALIAVCLAFLRYNFFPASVFMGDSGSLVLGLLVGIISITGVVRTQGLMVMIAPLVIAGVPVLDTTSAIIRRLRGHQPIGQADMGHVHHRLMKAGLSQRRSVAALVAVFGGAFGDGLFDGGRRQPRPLHYVRHFGDYCGGGELEVRPVQAGSAPPLRESRQRGAPQAPQAEVGGCDERRETHEAPRRRRFAATRP